MDNQPSTPILEENPHAWLDTVDAMPREELIGEIAKYRGLLRNRERLLADLKQRDGRMWTKWGELADNRINDPMLANDVDCVCSELDEAFRILVDFVISKVQYE